MMSAVALTDVLLDPRVWRGRDYAAPTCESTGYAALDQALPGSGWPIGALVEILHDTDGIGELSVLLPLIARLTRAQKHVVMINPPYIPYAPTLAAAGVISRQLHVLMHCKDHVLWAADQCLRSGTCAAVISWPTQANDKQLRCLQLAAEAGKALSVVFRSSRVASMPSPAAVRVRVKTDGLQVLKCRGGVPRSQTIALMR